MYLPSALLKAVMYEIYTQYTTQNKFMSNYTPTVPGISAHKTEVNIYSHRPYTYTDYMLRNSRQHKPSHTLRCKHTENTHTLHQKASFSSLPLSSAVLLLSHLAAIISFLLSSFCLLWILLISLSPSFLFFIFVFFHRPKCPFLPFVSH